MEFEKLCEMVKDYTILDETRLHSLWQLTSELQTRGIDGDIVECGCYRGGSAAILRAAMAPQRRLWIYDSFEGMPNTGAYDGEEAKKFVGTCRGSVKEVLSVLSATGATPKEFIIRSGAFRDSFKEPLPAQVALLHCDADWYDSVSLVLETFYNLMPQGACVVLDDFGYWEGSRRAFYDFCQKLDEKPLLERVGVTQAYWIKGKEHNRDG